MKTLHIAYPLTPSNFLQFLMWTSTPVHARQSIYGNELIPLIPATFPTPVSKTSPETFQESLDIWEPELFPELSMTVKCYEFLKIVNEQGLDDTDICLITVSDGWIWLDHCLTFWSPSCSLLETGVWSLRLIFPCQRVRVSLCYQIPRSFVQILRRLTNLVSHYADRQSRSHHSPQVMSSAFQPIPKPYDWDVMHGIVCAYI
jgi:hypothetical protein